MEFLEYLADQLKNQSLTFAIFACGALAGFVIFFAVYFAVSHAKAKPIKPLEELNIDDIIDDAVIKFVSARTGNDFKLKMNLLVETAACSAEEIFTRYFGEDYKGYEVLPEGGYVKNGFKIPLVFTAYEVIVFTERLADDLQSTFENLLDKFGVKIAYPFARKYLGSSAKNPKDLRIADVFAAIYRSSDEEPEEKKAGVIKKFFAAKVGGVAMSLAAKYADKAFIEALDKVLHSVGLLCSRSLCSAENKAELPEEVAV